MQDLINRIHPNIKNTMRQAFSWVTDRKQCLFSVGRMLWVCTVSDALGASNRGVLCNEQCTLYICTAIQKWNANHCGAQCIFTKWFHWVFLLNSEHCTVLCKGLITLLNALSLGAQIYIAYNWDAFIGSRTCCQTDVLSRGLVEWQPLFLLPPSSEGSQCFYLHLHVWGVQMFLPVLLLLTGLTLVTTLKA